MSDQKHAKMTGWYDPPRLVSIGIRVAISTVFGEFADRREAIAAAREIDPAKLDPVYAYDSESTAPFWFDFVADTGDGWDSTFSIARLLAAPSLNVEGCNETLPTGRLLVMGGDQVYPTASREGYAQKLVAPYAQAGEALPPGAHDVYAIPGNHDWYDGLSAFLGLFCGRRDKSAMSQPKPGRFIGGRQTQQTRSYFALQLPHGWWLWGIDIQLEGYIDQPQIDFFDHVARKWMDDGSKLIICAGQPAWAYVDVKAKDKGSFMNFSYVESLATLVGKSHQVRLVLSGDSHHYARFIESVTAFRTGDGRPGKRHYITAGGGGAFLHPTHQLQSKRFDWDYPAPGEPERQNNKRGTPTFQPYARDFQLQRDTRFPAEKQSRALAVWNLAFAFLNPLYWATLGAACALFAWMLNANAHALDPKDTLLSSLLTAAGDDGSFWPALGRYFHLVFLSPWPSVLVLAAAGGYYSFAEPYGRARLPASILHVLAQLGVVVIATLLMALYLPTFGYPCLLLLYVAVIGGFLAATVMGIYLLVSLNVFKLHYNEAFSSLRIADYKNFLRLRIDTNGNLHVYPIGLTKVPRGGSGTLEPHLIEGPIPIE